MRLALTFSYNSNIGKTPSCSTCVEINKTVLVRELQNIGFHFDAVKKQWAEQEYLLKNASGRYANCTKVDGEKGYYVCLKYDPAA